MKTIHKYQLDPANKSHQMALKEGYRVVRAEYLVAEKSVFIWVEVPLSVEVPMEVAHFRLVASGEPVPLNSTYLATAIDSFAPESYHLYLDQANDQGATGAAA